MMRAPFFNPDVSYTRTNEWAKRYEGYVRIGIDDYSQSALGDVVFIDLPQVSAEVKAGRPFGSLEATKAVSDLNSPVSGRVVRVNRQVMETPGLVNLDPFGEGWLIEVKPSDPVEWDALMDVDSYKAYIKEAERS